MIKCQMEAAVPSPISETQNHGSVDSRILKFKIEIVQNETADGDLSSKELRVQFIHKQGTRQI